jgi:hypothetical protein
MRIISAAVCVLGVWAAAVLPASAGWDNVFQPTLFERWCNSCGPQTARYTPPVVVAQSSPCDPCQRCTTQYIQRSYYQPVTAYETRTVQEAVTTYRTSYYYEPVTTYRYSSYYDPCTCCYSQVAVPCTSYQLKAQSCPVQTWVSRCVQVPVTAYQKVDYWQPQTTCCSTTLGAPILATQPPTAAPPVVTPLPSPPPSNPQPPSIGSQIQKGASSDTKMWDQYYPQTEKVGANPGSTSWQAPLGNPEAIRVNEPQPKPATVKMDRIAVGPNSVVEGQVARSDNSPKPNAKVLFVNASTGKQQTIYTNTAGRFQTDLSAGTWHVYLYGADGLATYASRIDINGAQSRQVNLVSRSN